MLRKQLYTLACSILLLAAGGTESYAQTPDSFTSVTDSAIDNEGIIVFSDDSSDTSMVIDNQFGQGQSYSKTINFSLGPWSYSNSFNGRPEHIGIKGFFRELKELRKNLDFPFFMNTGFPLPLLGIAVFPMFLIIFIIIVAVALYIIGKKNKEKELDKRMNKDSYSQKQERIHEKSTFHSINQVSCENEKRNKGLVVIICGVILLFLSIILRFSWFIKIGALVLIIIGIVNFLAAISSNNSTKRP